MGSFARFGRNRRFFQDSTGNAKNREDKAIFSNHAIYLFLFLPDRYTSDRRWIEKDLRSL